MAKKATELSVTTASPSGAIVTDLQNSLGIDVGDIVKEVAKDYAKDTIFGKKTTATGRTKFSKALDGVSDFLRSVWWVPAAAYLLLGISIVAIKYLAKFAGV